MRKTKITILVIISLLLFLPFFALNKVQSSHLQVQDPIWSYAFGDDGWNGGRSVVACRSGGFIIASSIYNYSSASMDAWLIRLDEVGQPIWEYTYGTEDNDWGQGIVECDNGDFGVVCITEISEDVHSAFVFRINATGNLLWHRIFGGLDNDLLWTIVRCQSGGFAISGYTSSYSATSQDMWLLRIDDMGNQLWQQAYGGISGSEAGWGLVECDTGGFAIAGYTWSYGAGEGDMYLVRTDSNGTQLWNQTFGGREREWANGLVECADGGFALSGQTESFGAGGLDVWLVRTDINGNLDWDQTYGGSSDDYGRSLVLCSDQGFAIAGHTESFGSGPEDILVIRTDADGILQWAKTYGGYGSEVGWGMDLCINTDFVITGETDSFGAGGSDTWVLRIPDATSDRTTLPPSEPFTTWVVSFLLQWASMLLIFLILIIGGIVYLQQRQQQQQEPEHVFEYIRPSSSRRDASVDMQKSPKVKPVSTIGYCINCGAAITGGRMRCPTCHALRTRCMICNQFINANEEFVHCPHCGESAHRTELMEWIKVKGQCPKCGTELDWIDFPS